MSNGHSPADESSADDSSADNSAGLNHLGPTACILLLASVASFSSAPFRLPASTIVFPAVFHPPLTRTDCNWMVPFEFNEFCWSSNRFSFSSILVHSAYSVATKPSCRSFRHSLNFQSPPLHTRIWFTAAIELHTFRNSKCLLVFQLLSASLKIFQRFLTSFGIFQSELLFLAKFSERFKFVICVPFWLFEWRIKGEPQRTFVKEFFIWQKLFTKTLDFYTGPPDENEGSLYWFDHSHRE